MLKYLNLFAAQSVCLITRRSKRHDDHGLFHASTKSLTREHKSKMHFHLFNRPVCLKKIKAPVKTGAKKQKLTSQEP